MAAATREIIAAAQTIGYGFLPEKWAEEKKFLDAFLHGKGVDFLSPYYIAETREDARLLDALGPDCVHSLTTVEYENGPADDFTGPFYLYNVKPSSDSSEEYSALFVFGGASKHRHQGMSLDERIEKAQSAGRFYILDRSSHCEPVFIWPIPGREEKEFVSRHTPRLAGVGYYRGAFLVYELWPINTLIDPETYTLRWQFGRLLPAEGKPEQYGSVTFSSFPEGFDPFAIVNRRETLH